MVINVVRSCGCRINLCSSSFAELEHVLFSISALTKQPDILCFRNNLQNNYRSF